MVSRFIKWNSQVLFFHFGISTYSPIFVLFLFCFLAVSKTSSQLSNTEFAKEEWKCVRRKRRSMTLGIKEERERLAPQFCILKYSVLAGTKGEAMWVSLLQRRITSLFSFFFFPPYNCDWQTWAVFLTKKTLSVLGVFWFVFLVQLFGEVLSSWLWFVRCSC